MGSVTKDCDRRLSSLGTLIVVQALLAHYYIFDKQARHCNTNNPQTIWRSIYSFSQSIKFILTNALPANTYRPVHATGSLRRGVAHGSLPRRNWVINPIYCSRPWPGSPSRNVTRSRSIIMAPSCYTVCSERTRLPDPTVINSSWSRRASSCCHRPANAAWVDRAVSRRWLAPLGDYSTFNRWVVQNNGGLSSLNSGEAVSALMKTGIRATGTI